MLNLEDFDRRVNNGSNGNTTKTKVQKKPREGEKLRRVGGFVMHTQRGAWL